MSRPKLPEWISLEEAAAALGGRSRRWMLTRIRAGELHVLSCGVDDDWLVSAASLNAYLDRCKAGRVPSPVVAERLARARAVLAAQRAQQKDCPTPPDTVNGAS